MAEQSTNAADAPVPDDLGEQTKAQSLYPFGGWIDGGWLYASGGSAGNPCGFWNYELGYLRRYGTYRWMLGIPTLRHVRAISTSIIVASEYDYAKRDDSVPDDWVETVKRNIDPLRRRVKEDAYVRGRDMGWAGFEPIWDVADGEYRLVEMKPLLQDRTTILANDNGRFTGLGQGELTDAKGLAAPFKAWIYTYDRECGNLYGRSWLENCRETSFKDWLDCGQQMQLLCAKLSGVQAIGLSPPDKKDATIAAIKALKNGAAGAWLPSLAYAVDPKGNADLWKLIIELSKTSLTSLEVIDFGNNAPAIAGILARMQHAEELMFQAGLQSSRTGMEGKHGTKAEAAVHTDTGTLTAELDDDDLAEQLQPMVNAILVLNHGPEAMGAVTIDPQPLVDSKVERAESTLKFVTSNDNPVAAAIAASIKWDQLLKDLDVPMVDGADKLIKDALAKAQAAKDAQGNAPDPNVDATINPRHAEALASGLRSISKRRSAKPTMKAA